MEVVNLSIDKIKKYDKNAKIHTDEQIQHIANSIEQFGMNDPIGIWGEQNIIVEGHGRYEALKLLGEKEIPCIRLDHLTDEERRAYTLAHNQTTLTTDYNYSVLDNELKNILDIDMTDFGFMLDVNDIDNYMPEIEKQELKPYKKAHYLITIDVNDNDKIIDILEQLKNIEGLELESTLN